MSRKNINGVLHNFLGTYTSRYSDYDGYWLFGMLATNASELKIDLLGLDIGPTASAPKTAAILLAVQKFREQMVKAGFDVSVAREAWLDITKLPELQHGFVNGRAYNGHNFRFMARVVTEDGKVYERGLSVFVAPHDPHVESRSRRGS